MSPFFIYIKYQVSNVTLLMNKKIKFRQKYIPTEKLWKSNDILRKMFSFFLKKTDRRAKDIS